MVFWEYEPIFEQSLYKDLSKKHIKTLHLKTPLINHQNIHKLLIGVIGPLAVYQKVVLVSCLVEEMPTISVYDIVTITIGKAVAEVKIHCCIDQ